MKIESVQLTMNGYLINDTYQTNGTSGSAIDISLRQWLKNNEAVLPSKSPEELALDERVWRDRELRRADIEIFKKEDTVGVFDAESWRSYRLLLRAWPDSVDFPDSSKRPVAPDAV